MQDLDLVPGQPYSSQRLPNQSTPNASTNHHTAFNRGTQGRSASGSQQQQATS